MQVQHVLELNSSLSSVASWTTGTIFSLPISITIWMFQQQQRLKLVFPNRLWEKKLNRNFLNNWCAFVASENKPVVPAMAGHTHRTQNARNNKALTQVLEGIKQRWTTCQEASSTEGSAGRRFTTAAAVSPSTAELCSKGVSGWGVSGLRFGGRKFVVDGVLGRG